MPNRKLTFRMVEAFRAVMISKGISAGADALGITQPAMSRIILELQKAVGYPLFNKQGRSVVPTKEAHELMEIVEDAFMGLEEISSRSEQLKKQRSGTLTISTIPAIGYSVMPDLVAQLGKTFPDVLVQVNITTFTEVARDVQKRRAEIGITADPLGYGNLETITDLRSTFMCIGSKKTLGTSVEPVTPSALHGKPFIHSVGSFKRKLDGWLYASGITLEIRAEASQFQFIGELALRDVGVSIVDWFTAVKHVERGGVALQLEPPLDHAFYVTAASDTRISAPAAELIRLLKRALPKPSQTHRA